MSILYVLWNNLFFILIFFINKQAITVLFLVSLQRQILTQNWIILNQLLSLKEPVELQFTWWLLLDAWNSYNLWLHVEHGKMKFRSNSFNSWKARDNLTIQSFSYAKYGSQINAFFRFKPDRGRFESADWRRHCYGLHSRQFCNTRFLS